jgi:predicted transcriptional regulator
MNTNVLLSKTYVNEIVSDYREIVNNVDEIIAQTGYKGKFIAQKLGIPESSFYQKKRMKTFSLNEIERIVDLMDEDDEDIEDEYFMKLYKERENEFKSEPIIENIIDVLMDDVKKREKNER